MTNAQSLSMLNLSGRRRLPVIRQTEAAECGLASLAMVAGYFGFQTDLSTLRRQFNTSIRGMSLASIMQVAEKLNFTTRPVKLPLEAISQLRLPAILHWDVNHFVVLKAVKSNKLTIHNPAFGERSYSFEEFSKHFTGVALELTPTENFKKRNEKNILRLSDLWGRMIGFKTSLLQVLVLSIVLQVFVLASPFYLQIAVDDVAASFDRDLLLILALGFGGFTVINMVAQTLRGYVLLYFGSMLSFQMSGNLFRHLLRLPIEYFEKRHVGDILSRFDSVDPIKKMLTESLIGGLIDGVMAITTLVLMFIYSPLLAVIALFAWAIYLALRVITYRSFRACQEDLIISGAKERTTFIESVRGVTSLKLFGGEDQRYNFWQNRLADTINDNARLQKLNIWFESANIFIFGIELVLLIYVAIHLVLNGGFTIGMIFAFMAYKQNFTKNATALVETAIEYRLLDLHLERLADVAHADKEEVSDHLSVSLVDAKPITGLIEVKSVSYSYSTDTPNVLQNVNLKVEPGTSIAIIGSSGCGKSTLLKIMTGLFQPTDGQVLIDGIPLTTYGLQTFRKQIGVVMQDDDLFAGTIAENISFFDTDIDMERISDAAKAAMIHDEIMDMPMRYESLVGDMGSSMSGGQKQRLMLARALYRKPKVLFMDEGTANLDVATERAVNASIIELDITRIIIAHRPETIRMADRIVEMHEGCLSEIELEAGPSQRLPDIKPAKNLQSSAS